MKSNVKGLLRNIVISLKGYITNITQTLTSNITNITIYYVNITQILHHKKRVFVVKWGFLTT